jgi:cytochrome c oxidase cbb3-type subunit 4
MEFSTLLQQIADNATLVWMFSFFLAMVVFIFRPGSRKVHDDAAQVPLRERENLDCPNACPACTCASAVDFIGATK